MKENKYKVLFFITVFFLIAFTIYSNTAVRNIKNSFDSLNQSFIGMTDLFERARQGMDACTNYTRSLHRSYTKLADKCQQIGQKLVDCTNKSNR